MGTDCRRTWQLTAGASLAPLQAVAVGQTRCALTSGVERCQHGWWGRQCSARLEGSWRCQQRGRDNRAQQWPCVGTASNTAQQSTAEHSTARFWTRRVCRSRSRRMGQQVQHQRLPRSSLLVELRKICGAGGPVGAASHLVSVSATRSSAGASLLRRTAGHCPSLRQLVNRIAGKGPLSL